MSDEPALLHLLTHLYGSVAGRFVASKAHAKAGEKVIVLLPDGAGLSAASAATGRLAELGGAEELGELVDPLPAVQFHTWLGGGTLLDPDDFSGWNLVVGPIPAGRHAEPSVLELLAMMRRTAGPGARALFFIPSGGLARGREQTRRALLEYGRVTDLAFPVERPSVRKDGVGTSLSMAVARWDPGVRGETDETRIHALGSDRRSFDVVLDLERPWSYSLLDPKRQQRVQQWAQRGTTRHLAELVEFPRTQPAEYEQLLEARQITAQGIDFGLELPERLVERRQADPPSRVILLREGDIVGRSMREPYWTRVSAGEAVLGLAVVPHQVVVLRPTNIDARLLEQFLNSDAAESQLEAYREGDQFLRVNRQVLGDLLVPELRLPPSVLRDPDPLLQFEQLTTDLVEELRQRRKRAFDRPVEAEVSAAISDAMGDAEMASELLRRVADPVQRAREFLPHPLARIIRMYSNHRANDTIQAYHDLLSFGETLMVLLGVLGLSHVSHVGGSLPDEWQKAFRRGGPNFGHWLGAARDAAEHARRTGEPLGGLAQALSTHGSLMTALDVFLDARNGNAHGARPQGRHDYERRTDHLDEQLQIAVQELGALSRSDWFIVEKLDYDQSSALFTMTGKALKGEHPDFATWIGWGRAPLSTHVVYARLGALDLPLAGFCRLKTCPTCGHEELYYPDRQRSGRVRLLSLDRGHELEVSDAEADLPV